MRHVIGLFNITKIIKFKRSVSRMEAKKESCSEENIRIKDSEG